MKTKTLPRITVGCRISWKAAGKVARLEGKAGQVVTGKVRSLDGDNLVVDADHRQNPKADFPFMGCSVRIADVLSVSR